MDAKSRTASVDELLTKLSRQISDEDFAGAEETIQKAAGQIGENDPELTSARALISFVEQK